MAITAQCAPADYDATTGVCADPFFAEQPGLLPELPIDEANLIVGAAAFLLSVAWVFKRLRRVLDEA